MRPLPAIRNLALAAACAAPALLLLSGLAEGLAERRLARALHALPDHDATADILRLKNAGRIAEALAWAREITLRPELPGQVAASNLVAALEREQASVWKKVDRAAKGFITGSGGSAEEMGGAVTADLLVYGDCRDLAIQAFNRLSGRETDGVVAALAGVGLLTEFVDAADWAPALLKALRKANALSQRFAEWLAAACRRSLDNRALDPALAAFFGDLKRLHDRLGTARTAVVFRHAGDAADVAFLAKHADAHPADVYRLLSSAGEDGLPLLRRYAGEARGFDLIALATRKGQAGLAALRRGGELRPVTLFARYSERVLRTLRLRRPQQLLHALAMRSPAARAALGSAAAALLVLAFAFTVRALAALLPARRRDRHLTPEAPPHPSAPV